MAVVVPLYCPGCDQRIATLQLNDDDTVRLMENLGQKHDECEVSGARLVEVLHGAITEAKQERIDQQRAADDGMPYDEPPRENLRQK